MYIVVQGGGWCNNVRACQFRKVSRRGSSDLMEKEIPFGGIMSSSPLDNPGPSVVPCSVVVLPSIQSLSISHAHIIYIQISTTGTG